MGAPPCVARYHMAVIGILAVAAGAVVFTICATTADDLNRIRSSYRDIDDRCRSHVTLVADTPTWRYCMLQALMVGIVTGVVTAMSRTEHVAYTATVVGFIASFVGAQGLSSYISWHLLVDP